VNPIPTISRSGGNASQTVNQNAAITTITYTASNATGISRSGSTFPTGLNGSTAGLVYTISGAPSGASTYGYTVTTTNNGGCTNATASGTITVVPQYAASTRTWVYGGLTWSDAIRIPDCKNTSFTDSYTIANCRSYTSGTNTWYYYNWTYVNQNASTLCSSPWRVPTQTDAVALANSGQTYSTLSNVWGFGGSFTAWAGITQPTTEHVLWTTTNVNTYTAYEFEMKNSKLSVIAYDKYCGYQVRCVK
jgi:hypothetical protein